MLAAFTCLGFFLLTHAIPLTKLSSLGVGMMMPQIEQTIGKPQHIRSDGAGGTVFCYGGLQQLRWCSVEIYFGANGRVAGGLFHDH